MKEKNVNVKYSVLGFSEALCITFIVLKFCKVIEWSWWWVLAPIWISFGLAIVIIAIIAIAAIIANRLGY